MFIFICWSEGVRTGTSTERWRETESRTVGASTLKLLESLQRERLDCRADLVFRGARSKALSGLEGLLEVVGVLRSKKQGVEWVGKPAGSGVCVEEQEARR